MPGCSVPLLHTSSWRGAEAHVQLCHYLHVFYGSVAHSTSCPLPPLICSADHCTALYCETPALKSRSGVLLGLVERISCLRMIRCDVSADWLGLVMVQKIACRAMHFTWSHYQFSLSSCPQACLISLMATFHYTIYSFSVKNLKLIIRESSIFYSILCETHEFEKKDYAGLWCIKILFCQ